MTTAQDLGLEFGLAASDVFDRLRHAADQEGCAKRVLAFHLDQVHERKLWFATPYSSTEHFAAEQLDMSARRCREYVDAGRALRNLPLLDEAFLQGRVSWSKLVRLLKVIQRETQEAWTEFAATHSWREVREEVRACKPGQRPGEGSDYGIGLERKHVTFALTDSYVRMLEEARAVCSKDAQKPLANDELLMELLCRVVHGVEGKDGEVRHPMLPPEERNHEDLDPEVKATVLRRDLHRCHACGRRHDLHVHHIEPRSRGGSNDPSNLLTLCRFCHATTHAGDLIISGNPETKTIQITDRQGQRLARIGRGVRTPDATFRTGAYATLDQ